MLRSSVILSMWQAIPYVTWVGKCTFLYVRLFSILSIRGKVISDQYSALS